MDNKLYTTIKKNIKEILIYIIIFFVLLFVFSIKLPWSVNTPGGLLNIDERLTGEKYESEGSFNLTYVSFIEGNISSIILSFIIPEWDLVKNEDITIDGEELEIANKRDKIHLEESISNATYVAYTNANKTIDISKTNNYISYIVKEAKTDLKVGDLIQSIDGIDVNKFSELTEIVGNHKLGDTIEFIVLRDGKEKKCIAETIEIENAIKVGISISTIQEYTTKPNIDYHHDDNESGSSGGLMLSLAMYNALIKEDITKGLTISGTGTIDINGNVGEIAGVKYKLSGAVKNKSDIFIVPAGNYQEAIELKKENNYDIEIIKAENFHQVLEELNKV